MREYYDKLGLEESATVDDIKRAYRLYASKYHPDKHSGDKFFEERFKEINYAYEYLIKEKSQTNTNYSSSNEYTDQHSQTTSRTEPKNNHMNTTQLHPVIIWTLYLFGLFIPFAGAGFMADIAGGVGAVITFIVLFSGYIYYVTKK